MVHFLSDLGHRVALKEVKAENMLPVSPSLAYRQMQEDFSAQRWWVSCAVLEKHLCHV